MERHRGPNRRRSGERNRPERVDGDGIGTGIATDYAHLGIAVLPVGVVTHRTLPITTVAVLAAGSASDATVRSREGDGRGFPNGIIAVGILQWIVALAIPLFDLL